MKKEIKAAGGWLIVIFLAFAALAVLAVGSLVFRYHIAEPRGTVEMHESVTSGAAQQYSYNHFFDLCSAIQGYETSIIAQRDLLKSMDDKSKDRVATNIAAISAERSRAIAQYNVDARKTATLAKYKASGIPDFIDANNEKTSCQN